MISHREIKGFFQEKGLTYLPRLEFDTGLQPIIEAKCKVAHEKGELDIGIKWLGSYYGKEYDEDALIPLYIEKIGKHVGYGVFAEEEIAPFTYIGEYTGILRKKKAFFHKSNDYCFGYEIGIGKKTRFYIDAEKAGNITRFINHSEHANLEPLALYRDGVIHIMLRTTGRIKKGEQLVYDYGSDYWKKRYDKVRIQS